MDETVPSGARAPVFRDPTDAIDVTCQREMCHVSCVLAMCVFYTMCDVREGREASYTCHPHVSHVLMT